MPTDRAAAQAAGVWAVLIVAAVLVGIPLRRSAKIGAPPLTGGLAVPNLAVAVVVLLGGVVLARWLPAWCERVTWRRLLVGAALVAVGWGMSLALVRGPSGLDRGLSTRYEYPAVVDQVDRTGVGPFVDTFTDAEVLASYPIHIQGHPVGAALVFVGLDRIGLGGAIGGAAAMLVASVATVPAVLVAVREVADERLARRAAPFLVLAPAAIWTVTSADALYTAVGALAVLLVVLATHGSRPPLARAGFAVAGGVGFGLGIHLSYGLAPLVVVAVAVVVAQRRYAVLLGAAVGGAAVVGAFTASGFWWFDGLAATHVRYLAGVASRRSYAYFTLLGNPAALALALGPAAFVAVRLVRDRRLWLLAGAGLAAVAVSDLSGLSKAEVERIWLPFVPWVLVLAAGLPGCPSGARRVAVEGDGAGDGTLVAATPADATGGGIVGPLLIAQVVTAVAIESVVRTIW
ncbi:MAG: hypothetical protein ACR2MB_02225 [Acidimicrobiales bacterium]